MAFIIKPLVTEKMTKITDKQPNRYGFVVRPQPTPGVQTTLAP